MSVSTGRMRLAIGAFVALASQAALAYETPVHAEITRKSFNGAVFDRDFLKDLGILHIFDGVEDILTEPLDGNGALGWAILGSIYEDNNIRSRYHFFDPLAAANSQGLGGTFQSAPDRAFDLAGNGIYSLPGTRQSLYGALTNTDTIVRPKMWRDTFRGLGQFTHLLQDMAQPQHVRNDSHFSVTEAFYYIFPDYSRYEKRTLFLSRQLGGLNYFDYPIVRMPTYRGYWNNGTDSGLAQHTNLNFVSEGTNLDTNRYGSPLGVLLKEEVIPQVFNVFNQPIAGATDITVQYVSYSYTDRYNGAAITNDRLSTYSLFDFQRMQSVARHAYTLNNFNHDTYAGLLIPRAVGYSTGLISRFFRGSLEIARPDLGVYGIVDHSTFQQTDALNGFVGFDTIKLKVRDATAGSEALAGGRLVAVAKFHRNGCYKDDLSGEFTSGTPPCNNFRTDTEEIVVSSNSFDNVTLDKTVFMPLTFTFSQQIPINATDLYIQVVYRGPIGNDPDEIAVGTKDVFEPTFLALFNGTDRILLNGVFIDTAATPPPAALDEDHDGAIDTQYDRTDMEVLFGFTDGFTASPLGTIDALPPARYSRVALLTDRAPYPAPIQNIGVAFNTARIYQFGPERNQYDIEAGTYRVAQFQFLRGVPVWGSLTSYKFVGSPDTGDLLSLPALPNKNPYPLTSLTFKP